MQWRLECQSYLWFERRGRSATSVEHPDDLTQLQRAVLPTKSSLRSGKTQTLTSPCLPRLARSITNSPSWMILLASFPHLRCDAARSIGRTRLYTPLETQGQPPAPRTRSYFSCR